MGKTGGRCLPLKCMLACPMYARLFPQKEDGASWVSYSSFVLEGWVGEGALAPLAEQQKEDPEWANTSIPNWGEGGCFQRVLGQPFAHRGPSPDFWALPRSSNWITPHVEPIPLL